ncbi:hypothetical protein H310_15013 [Aphanomyces invadans]|uniref:C3H1-type domain-containing protein n=1 Tax=Aphanomyces invadans TaxID=157072 RepID=A0A024T851_9STRA|nr:hypothetical protein H310_15013 [Aphanomyces invadans]ETV90153.1 hypothetical protein H310_15013 [Aphanomyces invadans]|eukprot:XP_008881215.1 hypothetical protein H310_15013 [Aphanomyces invadans]
MNPPLPPSSSGGGGYPCPQQQPPLPPYSPPQRSNYSPAVHHAPQPPPRHHQNQQPPHPGNHPHPPPYYQPPTSHHPRHPNDHPPAPYHQHHHSHAYPSQPPQHHPFHHHHQHHDPHMQPPLPGYHDRHHGGPPPPGYHPPTHRPDQPQLSMDRPQGPYNPPPPAYHYPPPPNAGPPFMYQPQAPPLPSIPPMSYICRKCNLGGHWIHDCLKKQSHPNSAKPQASAASRPSEWQCEPCEKHFAMKSQYDAHMLTHEQCWAPGCDFSASKRVVTSHYQVMHGQYAGSGLKEIEVEGQKFQVLVGNSPEEITKWREERRKKWPSESNVKRKNEQMGERVQAGDIPANKKLKTSPALPGPTDGTTPSDATSGTAERPAAELNAATSAAQLPDNEVASPRSVHRAKPASSKKKSSKFCVKFIRNGCDDGDKCLFNHDIESIPCKQFLAKGSCKRGTQCKFSHTVTAQDKLKQLQLQHQKEQASQVKQHRSSLLRKLLAKDIDKEHRHILQAFRHLVEHHFFQPSADDDI